MNYRHIYHAGNICDVVKHAALTLLIMHLRGKEAPFGILDTHAGPGLYDLQDERARKTDEAASGILKLIAAPPLPVFADYFSVLQKLNPDWQPGTTKNFRLYPGSPLLAYHLLRPQDRLIACELHEEDARELHRNFHEKKQAQIHHRDGYEALRAFVPLHEKRGLVLIDPPYEERGEWDALAAAILEAHKRWPQGQYMIWYPIKERPPVWRFHEQMIASDIPKILNAEFIYQDEVRDDRLNGCGLILINPPWQTDEKLRELFEALHAALQTGHQGGGVKWLAA